MDSEISTNGLILSGRQLNEDEEFFIGDIQMLLIADSPDEAYHICTKYAPNCSNGPISKHFDSKQNFSSGARSSSRITSTRVNNKKKKQSLYSAQEVKNSTNVFGFSHIPKQNEQMVQINAASRSNLNELSANYNESRNIKQSNHTENVATPKNLKTNHRKISNFEADSDDYFDSIDESFYDEGDFLRTNNNSSSEQTGKFQRYLLFCWFSLILRMNHRC